MNGEDFILDQLNSIKNQTYKDFAQKAKKKEVKDHALISKGKNSAMAFWKKMETGSKPKKMLRNCNFFICKCLVGSQSFL